MVSRQETKTSKRTNIFGVEILGLEDETTY